MHPPAVRNSNHAALTRRTTYVAALILPLLAGLFLRRSLWLGTAHLHTTMEVVATVLAMVVGVLALVRYYCQKENIFLFLGTGFVGTSFLDGYHAFVSSPAFIQYFPSPPPSLIPWSGLASRVFLSVVLWLSWAFWRRESKLGPSARIPEYRVFFAVNTWTLACFLFFAVVPLPIGYWPVPFFHRPQEFIPIFFCLLALVGYLRKGQWRRDRFEHCLVLSSILFVVHELYMSSSARLYDAAYLAAHVLRLSSYGGILCGLVIAMYQLVREQQNMLAKRDEELQREIALRKSAEEASRAARAGQNSLSASLHRS